MSAADEEKYWSSLEGDAILDNTAGVPPYDLEHVASRVLSDWILYGVPCGTRILDLGCGAGRLTNYIAERAMPRGWVHGVDISRPLLDIAIMESKGLSNVHYWHGNGRTLPPGLGARNYDLVYSVTMFQHIPDDAKWSYISQVHQRLKPGGVFVFTIAFGDADEFLNHQIPDSFLFSVGLDDLFGTDPEVEWSDERGWTWITCRKATS